MPYYSFDRQILAKTESTEGTAIAVAAADFIDTLVDVELDFTPISFERNLVRPGLTMVPDLFASTGVTSGTMVGSGVISFTVEMSMKSGSTPVSAAPQWATLLKACGCRETTGVKRTAIGAITGGPFFNNEEMDVIGGEAEIVGTTFTGDSYLYYVDTGGTISSSDAITGSVSGATVTAGTVAAVGYAYQPDTLLGTGDSSSCTIQLYRAGREVTFVGCRGSVSFAFVSSDRVMMAFTMTGVLDSVTTTAATPTPSIAIGHALPSTFNSATLKLNEHGLEATPFTGALFESLTFDLGNEIVLRTDANSVAGFKAAQIVGRAPTVTLNPDAVLGGTTAAGVFDFVQRWVTGDSVRAEWKIGAAIASMDAQSALFRMPALVIDGVALADRDEIEGTDVTAKVTGGLIGDSVTPADGTTRRYDDRGYDNEFSIVLY